ncbi:hypothetical protein Sste5346_005880 [Sporothrix stenoceras]|uniref:ML-like domain-containing protein n=1 Tax=Sporothrix stenoceras TaxID=5173 RepID=A0ABR3Z265_9PEZI
MAHSFTRSRQRFSDLSLLSLAALFLSGHHVVADAVSRETAYVYGTDSHGVTRQLAADRTPALYTSDFGDCLGGKSFFNISAFDAAYYADNMTVVFHLDGTSNVHNESTMRNGHNNGSILPLTIYGAFALVPMQTASIPDIALQIPDFDGSVSLQIFANSTQSEIGCFQAAMTNGNSIGIPEILAPTIAFFVGIAMLCSFMTAAYSISVPLMRAHYAHSLSVVLMFETMQTFFLTGALSLHWPSVLVAWWSNFAWSAGIIDITPLVAQIGGFSGVAGNISQFSDDGPMFVKGGSGQLADQIYSSDGTNNGPVLAAVVSLLKRKVYNSSDPYDYTWGGDPVLPGVPLPGTWQSLSGTLGNLNIPGASAFTLCLFWMVIASVVFPLGLLGSDDNIEPRGRPFVHQDEVYIKKFGWLSARYKAGCYWFFAVQLVTQFARACILGGGADNESVVDPSHKTITGTAGPTAQLVILLLFEIAVLTIYAYWQPFESSRNAVLSVWILGVGRILVAALCIGLLPQIGISRIGATVIGFAIIVVQVLMLAVVLVLVAISAVSTWLSLTRNQDDFYSEMFFSVRKRYLETLLASATGAPAPLTRRQEKKQAKANRRADREAEKLAASMTPPAPSFSVFDVRRAPKIEDIHYANDNDSDGDSDVEAFGVHDVMFFRRNIDSSGPSPSGRSGRSGSSSRGGSDTTGLATDRDGEIDLDTLGALGDLGPLNTRRRRDTGSAASLVGAQIYDPARVIARLNRSRTSSAASLRSVPSAHDSIRRVSEMTAQSGPLPGPPQIGILAGRRSASPFGGAGGRASPYDMRSSSVPPVFRGESPGVSVSMMPSGRGTPNSLAGPVSRRMTPTKETLQRYSTERQSLQSLRSTPVPYPVPE